jgi:hypothetical protein
VCLFAAFDTFLVVISIIGTAFMGSRCPMGSVLKALTGKRKALSGLWKALECGKEAYMSLLMYICIMARRIGDVAWPFEPPRTHVRIIRRSFVGHITCQ